MPDPGNVPVESDDGRLVVEIKDLKFTQNPLKIRVGQSVTWINRDAFSHTATALDGSWDTGLIPPGEEFSITFDTPGTYDYKCTPHPFMRGSLEVVE